MLAINSIKKLTVQSVTALENQPAFNSMYLKLLLPASQLSVMLVQVLCAECLCWQAWLEAASLGAAGQIHGVLCCKGAYIL